MPLSSVDPGLHPRVRTHIQGLDEILGEGFVPGSSTLIAGPPGAGKSTLAMQILKGINMPSLYVSGEESAGHLKERADRLGLEPRGVFLHFETDVSEILPYVDSLSCGLVVLDSIQTLHVASTDALPGSPAQIRKCARLLCRFARRRGLVLIMVGQVTKQRTAAGPRLLEHTVDVVLSLDLLNEKPGARILAATKNRFGPALPACELSMGTSGLAFSPGGATGGATGREGCR